jgi:DNA (cytosine-5)-methyltransferase 1
MLYEEEQMSLFDQDTWSGKTSQEHSAATEEKTLPPYSKKRSGSSSRKPPLFLYLKKDGPQADASWETDGVLLGEYSMHSFGESPKDAVESHLSQILEVDPHQRYCLSARACQGILTRVRRRGKQLPEMLRIALEQMIEAESLTHSKSEEGAVGGKGALIQTDRSATLSTLQDQTLFQPVSLKEENWKESGIKNAIRAVESKSSHVVLTTVADGCILDDQGGSQISVRYDGKIPTLRAETHGNLPCVLSLDVYEMQAFGQYKDSGIASSLKARDYKDATDLVTSPVMCIASCSSNAEMTDGDISPTLLSRAGTGGNNVPSVVMNEQQVRHIVRRLTPLECERLQGFLDGWTDIGEWIDSKGKKHKEADSPRYKALGNSIAIPPWKWVLKRLCACYERDATMASLFDGIGGFPYIWEQINGKGSCLWASEIEEFPMAVTKLRFGGEND